MKIGAFLMNQARADADHAETTRRIVERAVLAEESGLDGVFVGDHIADEEYAFYEPLTVLTAVAEATERVHVGTGIAIAPLYNPVRLAARTATLDAVSDGRLVLGLGNGNLPREFDAIGVPIEERFSRTGETVELLRRLWTEERVDHDGGHFDLDGVSLHPKPVQEEVPIWLGVNGPRGIEYVAREGLGWVALSQVAEETWEERMETFADALAEHGRDVDDVEMAVLVETCVADSREEAVEAMREPVEEKYREYASRESPPPLVRGLDPEEIRFEQFEHLFAVGTPADVVGKLAGFREQGFDYVLARPPFLGTDEATVRTTIELLGEEVAPRLAE